LLKVLFDFTTFSVIQILKSFYHLKNTGITFVLATRAVFVLAFVQLYAKILHAFFNKNNLNVTFKFQF